jgi:hypothetical protein
MECLDANGFTCGLVLFYLRKSTLAKTMRKTCALAFVATLALTQIASVAQTLPPNGLMTVTLHSPKKYKVTNAPHGRTSLPDNRWAYDVTRAYFDFTVGEFRAFGKYDLSYGTLSDGHDDWFVVGIGDDERTVIKDLGQQGWNEKFKAPIIRPLPALKPGEHRYITTNGKGLSLGLPSGIRGAPSARDQFIDEWGNIGPPRDSTNRDINQMNIDRQPQATPQSKPSKAGPGNFEMGIAIGPKNSKRSRPAPLLARVVLGHLYLIHVVKAQSDFYVLVHVDGLVPRDHCTISWKRIPSP